MLGTVLLAAAFYALTAALAARGVLGELRLLPAAGVGVVLAVVSVLLASFGPVPVVAASLAADAAAVRLLFRCDWRRTALVVLAHFVLSVVLGIALFNLVRLLA